jgi:aspartate carbamoyltransferase catalytic subunit
MKWQRKDLLGLEELTKDEILLILETAQGFKQVLDRPIPVVPTLRGKTIANLFFEPSTRTATSFGLAAKRLSADSVSFSASGSSLSKGETILDTAKNIEAMRIDGVVVRHSMAGAPHFLARRLKAFVVNAGDGCHEHPTQGLLDLFTIQEKLGRFEGLKVLIVGDIVHSRVARSNIFGLQKLGASVRVCGPATLVPPWIRNLGVEVHYDLGQALVDADVVNILRIQLERQKKGLFPSIREYRTLYGVTKERLALLKKPVVIMHPGPINRGVELDPEVADGPHSVILEQVRNGVAVRMAVLYLLAGGETETH